MHRKPRLTEAQILAWARLHRRRTGRWPSVRSGPVKDAPGEAWENINRVLRRGQRGLRGGDSLAGLLGRKAGMRYTKGPLTEARILAWARAHRNRTGDWPTASGGAVADAPGETWPAVNRALERGSRGLPGGSSLARLLAQRRGLKRKANGRE